MNKIFLNTGNILPSLPEKNENTKGSKVSEKTVNDLAIQLKNAENYDGMKEILNNAVIKEDIEQKDEITYKCGDYIIRNLLTYSAEPEAQILKSLAGKNMSIAPEYVDSIKSGDYTILITKISGTGDDDLIPFVEGYNLLDEKAKQAAFKDINRLVAAGLTNGAIAQRGNNALYVTPGDKRVVITDWKKLRPVDDSEKQEILNTCHEIIYRK